MLSHLVFKLNPYHCIPVAYYEQNSGGGKNCFPYIITYILSITYINLLNKLKLIYIYII